MFKCPICNEHYLHQVFVDVGLRQEMKMVKLQRLQKIVQLQVIKKVVILPFQIEEFQCIFIVKDVQKLMKIQKI